MPVSINAGKVMNEPPPASVLGARPERGDEQGGQDQHALPPPPLDLVSQQRNQPIVLQE